jgi:cytochrome c553
VIGTRTRRALRLGLAAASAALVTFAVGGGAWGQGAAPLPADFPKWAFPGPELNQLDPTSQKYATVQIFDRTRAVDWHPEGHPAMPDGVKGRQPIFACGFCHLPEGAGRPENAALAGMPEDYLLRQITELRSGARRSPDPAFSPVSNMTTSMKVTPDAQFAIDAREAAKYYSGLKYTKHLKLIETDTAPPHKSNAYVYEFTAEGVKEPLGDRIIEGPEDFEKFENRDARLTVLAYVPIGAAARGAVLAKGNGADRPACSTCHGEGLKGSAIAPPIAGRLPTSMFRQLYAFQHGQRAGEQAVLMKPVVAALSQKDMVDLAVYVASLEP